jgi:hypothetical protein
MSQEYEITDFDGMQAEIAKLRAEADRIRGQYLDCAGHNAILRAALEALLERLTTVDYRFAGKLPFLLCKLDEAEEASKALAMSKRNRRW